MTLADLVEKAKATTKKWWKWILGGLIVLAVAWVLWKLRRQANEIAKLRAAITSDKELAKDLQAHAETESNAELAKALRDEVNKIRADILIREAGLVAREVEVNAAIKKAEAAKTWDELEAQAKGGPK